VNGDFFTISGRKKNSASINKKLKDSRCDTIFPFPLASAAYGGHRDLVDLFTQKYPCPKERYVGHTVAIIKWAGKGGHDDLVGMTLNPDWDYYLKGACALDTFCSALYRTTSLETLRRFVPEAEKWFVDPTRRCLSYPRRTRAKKLAEFRNIFLPNLLVNASERGLDHIVLYLLQEVKVTTRRSPNPRTGQPILYAAARSGNTATVRAFLESGDVPKRAIEHAALGGSINTVRLLLEQAEVHDHLCQALKNAIKREYDDIVMLLESIGVTLNAAERAEALMQARD
jgi:ankyrin repeat protein